MNRETAALKLTCLLGPLLAAIFSLHVWGEPLRSEADRLWMQRFYKAHHRAGFDYRAPRGTHGHKYAAEMLTPYLEETLDAYGSFLGLKDPRTSDPPFRILLLESKAHLKPHGLSPSDAADHQGGRYLPERREIVLVVGSGAQHRDVDHRVLRHQMTHLLLHLAAPDAEWSPWLEEGLAAYLEDASAGDRATVELLPSLERLLGAGREELRADAGEELRQGARLLVAYLHRERADGLSRYVREDRKAGAAPPDTFAECIGPHRDIEEEWMAWIRLRSK